MSQIQGGNRPILPIASTPPLQRSQSVPKLPSQTAPVQAPVQSEARQLIRRASLSSLTQAVPPEIGSPVSLAADRGGIEAMQQPPASLNQFSKEISQTIARAEVSLNAPVENKGFWSKVKTALVGGSERGSEARKLGTDLASHGLNEQAQKANSWGKWEARTEQGGLVQKLPQLGSTITSAVAGSMEVISEPLKLAGAVVGSVASGAQIVVEIAELRQNVRKLDDAMIRKSRADVIVKVSTMGPGQIQDAIQGLDQKIAQLESKAQQKPGRFKSLFTASPEKTGQKIELLKAQRQVYTQAQANLKARKPAVSPQSLAIAEQVVNSSFTKFKAARVLKNVLGIAAGAIGIAVLAGALATPVGWIAAGVGLAALGGTLIYNKVKANQREAAIGAAKTELKSLNSKLLEQGAKHVGDPEALQNDREFKFLSKEKVNASLRLLRVSPSAAAEEIIGTLKTPGDSPQKQEMKYLLKEVLGVSDSDYQKLSQSADGEQLLVSLIKRGMPMQPKL